MVGHFQFTFERVVRLPRRRFENGKGIVMRKQLIATIALMLLGLIAVGAGDAHADRGRGHGYGRVGVGIVVGPPFWGPWYYPPSYYYPPYYPPVVIERPAPPVYIEQSSPVESRPQAGYWYYCQSPGGYYPEVRECPGGWVKVLPRP